MSKAHKIVNYDEKTPPARKTIFPVDAQMDAVIDHPGGQQDNAFREGFAASSGIRPESAETGGKLDHPEVLDDAMPDPIPEELEAENSGLADN